MCVCAGGLCGVCSVRGLGWQVRGCCTERDLDRAEYMVRVAAALDELQRTLGGLGLKLEGERDAPCVPTLRVLLPGCG